MSDKIFFYVQPENILDNKFKLDKNESHHFIKVLRKSIGTEIWLTDGVGTVYKSIVEKIDKNIISGITKNSYSNYGENNIELNLGIGILKRDKMELVIEKATECGVSNILPIIMDRSIKRDLNVDRMNKIALAASKQCGRSRIPVVHPPIPFKEIFKINDNSIMAFHESGDRLSEHSISNKNNSGTLVLIGPEGDYSQSELYILNDTGAKILNLGNRRLRSETAAIVALASINQLFN